MPLNPSRHLIWAHGKSGGSSAAFQESQAFSLRRKPTQTFRVFLRVDAGLVQGLRQTSLFTVRGVLVHDALGDRFINSGGGGAQLRTGGGDALDQSDLIFLDGSLNARLHHTIPQVLLLAHLHTLHGGLDVRQLPSPPW